jgi:uncharacterized protein YjbI with pentapeptide repeats
MSANFAHQDLRQRSFQAQRLNGADFTGADLRGCNFQNAQLVGANFSHARLGTAAQQRWQLSAIGLVVAGLIGNAIARLISATIGQTPDDRAWGYGLVLFACLTGAAWMVGLQTWLSAKFREQHWAGTLAAVLAGALYGFFQVGSLTAKQPQAAIVGAMLGGGLLLGLSRQRFLWVLPVLTIAGTVITYSATVMTGIVAIVCLTGQKLLWGSVLAGLTFLYAGITLRSLRRSVQSIYQAPGTSFRGADLTNAQFTGADLQRADFCRATIHREESHC